LLSVGPRRLKRGLSTYRRVLGSEIDRGKMKKTGNLMKQRAAPISGRPSKPPVREVLIPLAAAPPDDLKCDPPYYLDYSLAESVGGRLCGGQRKTPSPSPVPRPALGRPPPSGRDGGPCWQKQPRPNLRARATIPEPLSTELLSQSCYHSQKTSAGSSATLGALQPVMTEVRSPRCAMGPAKPPVIWPGPVIRQWGVPCGRPRTQRNCLDRHRRPSLSTRSPKGGRAGVETSGNLSHLGGKPPKDGKRPFDSRFRRVLAANRPTISLSGLSRSPAARAASHNPPASTTRNS